MTHKRLPNESAKAFAAFTCYCELGDQRTIRAASEKHAKSIPLLKDWCKQHKWVTRAKLYDADIIQKQDALRLEALKHEAKLWAKRQVGIRDDRWEGSETLLEKVKEMMKFPIVRQITRDGKTVIEPSKWNFADAAKIMDVALKLRALAVGVATDSVRREHTGPDGEGPIQVEVAAIPFTPTHVRECYKAQARREIEREMEEAQKLLQNGHAENHEQTPNEKEQNQNGNGETHP